MIVFPNCKINIGLRVTGKRKDGYHDIETLFYPVRIQDALEIIDSPADEVPIFSHSGLVIDVEQKDNICVKAWHLLKKDFPHLPGIQLHLHKAIPIGAGLGGGSADAAFTLTALNEKYSLGLSLEQLCAYALQLGSDCPFFIVNRPCIATGRGEIFEPVNFSLSGYRLILVNPNIAVNTAWAFSQLVMYSSYPTAPAPAIQSIIAGPLRDWKTSLTNDFEAMVFEKYPEVGAIKKSLYEKGALFASLSGSGSTVFGIFKHTFREALNFPGNYFLKKILL